MPPAPSLAPPSRAPPAAVAGRAPDAARPNPRALRQATRRGLDFGGVQARACAEPCPAEPRAACSCRGPRA